MRLLQRRQRRAAAAAALVTLALDMRNIPSPVAAPSHLRRRAPCEEVRFERGRRDLTLTSLQVVLVNYRLVGKRGA